MQKGRIESALILSLYSYRSATTGSTRDARRAANQHATTAIKPMVALAASMVVVNDGHSAAGTGIGGFEAAPLHYRDAERVEG
jgi:hypothetical protein